MRLIRSRVLRRVACFDCRENLGAESARKVTGKTSRFSPAKEAFTPPIGQMPRISLLLVTLGIRLKKSLPHISVALRAVPNPPDGLFAQLIEMGFTHGTRPLLPTSTTPMSAMSISFGLLIVLFAILRLHEMHKLKPQIAGFRSQRMCPSCGLITSRFKARCLECGKSFL